MSAQTDKTDKGDKGYFLSLEELPEGEGTGLPELLSKLRFNDQGLIPVITQDATSGVVLMLAWMNREALEQTLATGRVTYFSRSRNELWVKGLTSGSFQRLVEMRLDCDGDAVLCRAEQDGTGACHTGRNSCFYLLVDAEAGRVVVADQPGVSGAGAD